MSMIVRDCPSCGKSARLPLPPPLWEGPKACPDCGAPLGVCMARGEPFLFHLFRMPEEGEAPHACRGHLKPVATPKAA